MNSKSLSDFVTYLMENEFTIDGLNDYKSISDASEVFFGSALPNQVIWKVLGKLKQLAKTVDFIDDL